jgi:hypothetical protein
VRPLLPEEEKSEQEQQLSKEFNDIIKDKYGQYNPALLDIFDNEDMLQPKHNNQGDTELAGDNKDKIKDKSELVNNVVWRPDPFNNAEVFLPHGDRNEIAKVIGRKGMPVGTTLVGLTPIQY